MADRGLIHYQPLTGPVWREPVAVALAWLPRGEPARPLERRVPSEFVYPPFYELYNPAGLHWLPSGRWPLYPETRKLGDFQQPPFQALYKPEQLGWLPTPFVSRSLLRGALDLTVEPIQFAAPAFDPQNLEWIPKGPPPQTFSEIRKLGDFVQPAFDALYKPEGLQWLFEGQLSVRGIPYTIPSAWVVDPAPVVAIAFDPQFFPFQGTDILLARTLRAALQSDFTTPPLPPGPDVIPPVAPIIAPPSQGGYANVRGAQLVWREWEALKKKRKEVERKAPQVARIIEEIAEQNFDLAPALKALSEQLDEENLRQAKIYRELMKLEIERNRFTAQLSEDDDEEAITLLLNG